MNISKYVASASDGFAKIVVLHMEKMMTFRQRYLFSSVLRTIMFDFIIHKFDNHFLIALIYKSKLDKQLLQFDKFDLR